MADSHVNAKNWRDLIKPRRLEVDRSPLTKPTASSSPSRSSAASGPRSATRSGACCCRSLQGAAITSVKIEGVEHEFTTIPEVTEDVTDIVLNLKEVLLRMHTNEPKTLRIEVEGPKEVKAGDIIADDQVEILNPGHHICTLAEGGKLRMEMTLPPRPWLRAGEQQQDPGRRRSAPSPSTRSSRPIRKVNYQVTNARVGQQYRLRQAHASRCGPTARSRPQDAVAYAAKIIKEQLTVFINFDETEEPVVAEAPKEEAKLNENLFRSVDELELSRALARTACSRRTSRPSATWCSAPRPRC